MSVNELAFHQGFNEILWFYRQNARENLFIFYRIIFALLVKIFSYFFVFWLLVIFRVQHEVVRDCPLKNRLSTTKGAPLDTFHQAPTRGATCNSKWTPLVISVISVLAIFEL